MLQSEAEPRSASCARSSIARCAVRKGTCCSRWLAARGNFGLVRPAVLLGKGMERTRHHGLDVPGEDGVGFSGIYGCCTDGSLALARERIQLSFDGVRDQAFVEARAQRQVDIEGARILERTVKVVRLGSVVIRLNRNMIILIRI